MLIHHRNSFFLPLLIILCWTHSASTASSCVMWSESKYVGVDISLLQETAKHTRNATEFESAVLSNGVLYAANPLAQLVIAYRKVDSGDSIDAIAYSELASHLASQANLCSESEIEFLSLVVRRKALEETLNSSPGFQNYYSLTYGLANNSLELLSQQFDQASHCVEMFFLSTSGSLSFSC